MSQILFIIPGLVGLFVFLYKRSPFPNKEYLLLIYPPVISATSLAIGSIFVHYANTEYRTIADILRLLSSIDGLFRLFADGPNSDHSLFSHGQFSAAIIVSAIKSLILKKFVNAQNFVRQSGLDFSDFTEIKLTLVELSNGKVYVGAVAQAPMESAPHALISVRILMSGEREKEGVLKYTTFYDPSDVNDINSDDLKVSITLSSIVTIREFDLEAFDEFLLEGKALLAFLDLNDEDDTIDE